MFICSFQSVVNFTSFVNYILGCLEDTNYFRFRLSLYKEVTSGSISDCIFFTIRHKVRNPKVHAYTKDILMTLTSLLYAVSSLRILPLNNATCCHC